MPNYDQLAGIPAQPAVSNGSFSNISQKDTNDYSIDTYQYPIDLSESPEYSGHKVVFFINVQGGGKIAINTPDDVTDIPLSQQSNFYGTQAAKGVADAALKTINTIGNGAAWLAGAVGADQAAEAAKNVTVALDTGVKKLQVGLPKRRLKAAIALYVPNSLSSSTSVNWSEMDNDEVLSGDLKAMAILSVGGGPNNASAGQQKGLGNVVQTAASWGAAKILGGQSYLQKSIGMTPGQSKAQQLFKSVDFREFDLAYSFAPKNEDEGENVMRIIKMFKHHMLPEYYDAAQYLYIYPSEFEIKYYKGSEENAYIERQYTAVLTRVSIDYTPNNQFMTFKNGMPTNINLTLSFKELALASKLTEPLRPNA